MGILYARWVSMMPIILESIMNILKGLLSYIGTGLIYFSVAGILLVPLLGRSFFPEGNLIDIILTAFK
jgi:hypothetical protein